ncbi:UNVERIFIED_CONTAM: DNA internalization-related competence protein ComEC/Rec2, partial [Bacteroidetes bacterium 56_B9]
DGVQADGVQVSVLWPPGNVWSTEDNENSVALKVQSGAWSTAILGDLPDPTEAHVNAGTVNLLKVAHHGSRYSTDAALLEQARPQDAL